MPDIHCYVPQCLNRSNGHVINDHLRAKNSCVSRALGTLCVTSSPRHELKSKLNLFFFFPIRWLFDFSALLLLKAPVVIFTIIFQSLRVTMHVVMNWCVKCCRLVVKLTRFLTMRVSVTNSEWTLFVNVSRVSSSRYHYTTPCCVASSRTISGVGILVVGRILRLHLASRLLGFVYFVHNVEFSCP